MYLRCKDADKEQNGLDIQETGFDLTLIKVLVLDTSLIGSNAFDCKKTLAVVEEMSIRRGVGHEDPNNDCP